jgi:hypothetical protein
MKPFLSFMSLLILLAADIAAVPGDAANLSGAAIAFGVIYTLFLALLAGFLIFLNELITSHNLAVSAGKGLSCAFLIAVPSPILGIIVTGIVLFQRFQK